MRILFIRHGDPDYVNDTLTEKGHREAALLAERAESLEMGDCFVSPLGRARHTADYSLEKIGREAQILDWLEEFPARVDLNKDTHLCEAYQNVRTKDGRFLPKVVWDMVPAYWTEHPEFFDREKWRESETARCSDIVEIYDRVTGEFDRFLAKYGYVRENAALPRGAAVDENGDVLLSFRHNLRPPFAPVGRFALHPVAQPCTCTDLSYRSSDGGAAERDRIFPRPEAGRCLPPVCGKRAGLLCGAVCRGL